MKRILLNIMVITAALLYAPVALTRQGSPDPQESQKEATGELAKEDKAELIRLSLELALVKKLIPDYNIIQKQDHFLLSTQNITAELVPQIEGITLVLLKPEEIQERAESRGDYVYYFRFREFKAEGSKVLVYLDNVPMYAKSPTRMAFGGGFTVEFQKKDEKWVGEIKSDWIV